MKFPRICEKSSVPGNYYEIENNLHRKKWDLERLLEVMQREQSKLDQAKFDFEIKKQDFVRFLARSSHPAQVLSETYINYQSCHGVLIQLHHASHMLYKLLPIKYPRVIHIYYNNN